jgi:tryptophan synthase alpha chain
MQSDTASTRLQAAFAHGHKVLNIYFTAGYPGLHDTIPTLLALQAAGADIVEIGVPFSDPVADGPTIQASNQAALHNGMTLPLLLEQLAAAKSQIHVPVVLMGYFNPIYI